LCKHINDDELGLWAVYRRLSHIKRSSDIVTLIMKKEKFGRINPFIKINLNRYAAALSYLQFKKEDNGNIAVFYKDNQLNKHTFSVHDIGLINNPNNQLAMDDWDCQICIMNGISAELVYCPCCKHRRGSIVYGDSASPGFFFICIFFYLYFFFIYIRYLFKFNLFYK